MTGSDIANTALNFKGRLVYLFGGNNIANGYGDCSDFTEYVYKLNGIDIGGDTGAQYMNTNIISSENVKPGDLVFFKNTYVSGKVDGVSHVGIMLNNDGDFIQLGKDGCTVESLDDSYWKKHFLSFNRVNGVSEKHITEDDMEETENISPITEGENSNNMVGVFAIIIGAILGLAILIPATGILKVGGNNE